MNILSYLAMSVRRQELLGKGGDVWRHEMQKRKKSVARTYNLFYV